MGVWLLQTVAAPVDGAVVREALSSAAHPGA